MKEIIKSEYHNLIGNKHKLVPASPKKTKKKTKTGFWPRIRVEGKYAFFFLWENI